MIIQSKRIWIGTQFLEAQLQVEGNKIVRVFDYNEKPVDQDYGDNRIIPGMIDVHTHGAFEFDTNDANEEGLRKWAKGMAKEGVTAYLPTTVTQSEEVLTRAVANVAKVKEDGYEGAEILGIHFEGPYLDQKYKGAQPEQHIYPAHVEQFKRYQAAAKGNIKLITLACEHDEDFALTRYCAQHDVAVSIGHTSCTYHQAMMGIANGAKSMTHVFNGMTPLNHREPAMVGAAMRVRDIFGEIICDGVHIHWAAVNAYFMAKGKDHAIMITDALCAKGSNPGEYLLGGNDIEIRANGSAYLKGTNTLAGSTLMVNRGLQNLVEKALIPFDWAIAACTVNPATLLRVDDRKGKLVAGFDADIVVLADNYDVIQTYCLGKAML